MSRLLILILTILVRHNKYKYGDSRLNLSGSEHSWSELNFHISILLSYTEEAAGERKSLCYISLNRESIRDHIERLNWRNLCCEYYKAVNQATKISTRVKIIRAKFNLYDANFALLVDLFVRRKEKRVAIKGQCTEDIELRNISHKTISPRSDHARRKSCFERSSKPRSFADRDSRIVSRRIKRYICLLYTSPSPRDRTRSRMPSSA